MTFFNCETCMNQLDRKTRGTWRCGRVYEHERTARSVNGFAKSMGAEATDLCPGYLISLPQVIEAACAHTCWKEGQLADAYPDADRSIDGVLLGAVLELNQALGEAEAEALAKMGSK